MKAHVQLVRRILDTQPKFADFIGKQAASGQLSGKQLNDLAAMAKSMQVKGKTDQQVMAELSRAIHGMNPTIALPGMGVSTAQAKGSTAPNTPLKANLPAIKDPKLNANVQLIGRVLDTAPKFAEYIGNLAANKQLTSKQVNDLAALAKAMQVKGKSDKQVVLELGKAMNGMNPSQRDVFIQETVRGVRENGLNNVKEFGIGAYEATKQNVIGAVEAAKHPITTARGVGNAISTGAKAAGREIVLGGQALGVLGGDKQAARAALGNQVAAAGQYVTKIAENPKSIGAATANGVSLALPMPGAKALTTLAGRAATTTAGRVATTAAGKTALAALDKAAVKVGAVVDLGKGVTGKVTQLLTGKDGKEYALVQTSDGLKRLPIENNSFKMQPRGARAIGEKSRRPYDPEKIGIPIAELDVTKIRITHQGIDVVVKHIERFGQDTANGVMVQRLRRIASGEMKPSLQDLNYYAHELREYVRYRKLGYERGAGEDAELWNNTHTATLEDYGINESANPHQLYHSDAIDAATKAGEW